MEKYHMNRRDREIEDELELKRVVRNGKFVVISMCSEDSPYVVTLNYGYDDGKNALYFHTAFKGLKLDIIKRNPNVCATVIEDLGYKPGECDHSYRSVVFWGKMSIIEDLEEKKYGLNVLFDHLEEQPEDVKKRLLKENSKYEKMQLAILRLDIEEMTGKEGV
jgi:nitroimidazol reductase NimA-like FMN-containing flavoprotein (pyridoxamine 5'-phosphate oxidase superfamily)